MPFLLPAPVPVAEIPVSPSSTVSNPNVWRETVRCTVQTVSLCFSLEPLGTHRGLILFEEGNKWYLLQAAAQAKA